MISFPRRRHGSSGVQGKGHRVEIQGGGGAGSDRGVEGGWLDCMVRLRGVSD